jgi:hypothetical protein
MAGNSTTCTSIQERFYVLLSSVSMPHLLHQHHAPFPAGGAIIEPWNWVPHGVWYFFMGGCCSVPLNTVI